MFLEHVHFERLLSFRDTTLALRPLNVLIGPNGSGKSNLVESIGLLRACATNLRGYLDQGGRPPAWIWRGEDETAQSALAEFRIRPDELTLTHKLKFSAPESQFQIDEEDMRDSDGRPWLHRSAGKATLGYPFSVRGPVGLSDDQSLLAQFRSPADPRRLTDLASRVESIRIYRDFNTSKHGSIRQGLGSGVDPQLAEDGSTLALALHELWVKDGLTNVDRFLTDFAPQYRGVKPHQVRSVWTLRLHEEGLLDATPSPRISDGTLRFLCLLAIILDPDPPPLVCLEEPETGLHPDAVRIVAQALVEASSRMQLVVTTHSPALIANLGGQNVESVIVCEKDTDQATTFERLNREDLGEWLNEYSLGELWLRGQIGGNP
ncbi:MAG: AAA family ATPase [Bryobacteraceae bacterium]